MSHFLGYLEVTYTFPSIARWTANRGQDLTSGVLSFKVRCYYFNQIQVQPVVDFLFVIVEPFSLSLTVQTLYEEIC